LMRSNKGKWTLSGDHPDYSVLFVRVAIRSLLCTNAYLLIYVTL